VCLSVDVGSGVVRGRSREQQEDEEEERSQVRRCTCGVEYARLAGARPTVLEPE
jgi:hypothetical protein